MFLAIVFTIQILKSYFMVSLKLIRVKLDTPNVQLDQY